MSARGLLKRLAYGTGGLSALHRRQNRDRLTVVMFHRVLPEGAAAWADADPTYAMTDRLFAECLAFFAQHYNVVGETELLEARDRRHRLPERPLLITFDDGWVDNLEVALPLLRRAGLPAAVFAVAGLIDDAPEPWWEECLAAAWRRGRLEGAAGEPLCHGAGLEPAGIDLRRPEGFLALAAALSALPPAARARLLAPFLEPGAARQILTPAQLRDLMQAGLAIGSHGFSHAALTMVADPAAELAASRRRLRQLLDSADGPLLLSYPHGRHRPEIAALARSAGYRAQFTSDPHLNRLEHGLPLSDSFGRIAIEASAIADATGRLRRERLAGWLFLRPTR
ncbi:MAG: polysaccharide deacetylase family protein [Dongiaceae bacterium]